MILTYNIKLQFESESNREFWKQLLDDCMSVYNFMSDIIWNNNDIYLNLKNVHHLCYNLARLKFPDLPSQTIISIQKLLVSNYRTTKRKFKCCKKNPSLNLDKRLYSKLTPTNIRLVSETPKKRCVVSFKTYKKFNEMCLKYVMKDPTISYSNGEFFLHIPFEVPEKPVLNNSVLGVDLGIRRFYTTSDGDSVKGTELNRIKRKTRYLKRCMQSKKKSHSARNLLKKYSKKEYNISKNFCHMMSNSILKTDKNIIVLEDLTGLKQSTSKFENGFKRKSHNNRISQVPFYMFKSILMYKALLCGKKVETVSPKNTSKTNSISGKIDGTRNGCRYYTPDSIVLDADWNAAINIAKRYGKKHSGSFKTPIDGSLNFLDRALNQQSNRQSIAKSLDMANPIALAVG